MRNTTVARRRALKSTLALILVVPVLAACGSDESETGSDGVSPAATSAGANSADVRFTTEMIPHHGEALAMAEMLEGRDVDPRLAELGRDITAAQTPEIELMSGWLRDWDEPVPDPDEGGMGASDMDDMDDMEGMEGMGHDGDLAELEGSAGKRFQSMWLAMMIAHHRTAVEMAQEEQSEGSFEPAVELAAEIEQAQTREIATMKKMLADG